MTGSFIGSQENRGKGFGSEAARLRAWYCFQVLGLNMIRSGHLEGNEASKRMSEKLGFKEYGRLPQAYWKRGEWRTEVLLYLTREMWLESTGGECPLVLNHP
jgi:RimJ/RimL family protein N-acetyltransferase